MKYFLSAYFNGFKYCKFQALVINNKEFLFILIKRLFFLYSTFHKFKRDAYKTINYEKKHLTIKFNRNSSSLFSVPIHSRPKFEGIYKL